ncbi:MAG: LAGLIDADG family homing endonuclease, partial [Candidatus Omnitrophota bacterium]
MQEIENPQRLYVQKAAKMKLEPQWIVGFVDGEGCFHVGIAVHKEMTVGYQILPEFNVVQHKRDEQVLHALKAYFGCGVVRKNHDDRLTYRVRKFEHLTAIIAPFFMKHSLKTKKNTDFKKFCSVLRLMEKGRHLTVEGLEEIKAIAEQMNVKGIHAEA